MYWQEIYGYSSFRQSVGSAVGTRLKEAETSTGDASYLSSPATDRYALPNLVPPNTPTALLGIDLSNNLYQFTYDPQAGTTTSSAPVAIAGLLANEQLIGIDLRPADGLVYGLSNNNRIYQIGFTQSTASAVFVSSLSTPFGGSPAGIDFNPQADRLRANGGGFTAQNYRINVDTGAVNVDTPLAYAVGDPNAGALPLITGAAYSNNFAGTTSTTLYNIDFGRDVLVRQDPANSGVLTTVGSLGFDFGTIVGFDILTLNGQNYTFATNGIALYTIDLNTGLAQLLSSSAVGGPQLAGLVALPEPTTGGLTGFAVLALLSRLRRRTAAGSL